MSIFTNRDAISSVNEVIGAVIMQSYPDLKETFKREVEKLREIAKSPDAVDDLIKEEGQYDFLAKFRDVLRIQNTLKTFNEFRLEVDAGSLGIDEQELMDYQSKYLDKKENFIYRARLPDIASLLALLKVLPKITARKATAESMRDRLVDLAREFERAEVGHE